jgi:DNA-binding response OmpR family regulator
LAPKVGTAPDADANDYLTKPFDRYELLARVWVGTHVLQSQKNLSRRVDEPEVALFPVKGLQG